MTSDTFPQIKYALFSWNGLGLYRLSNVNINLTCMSPSPSSTVYNMIPMRPHLLIEGHMTCSDAYKVCVPLFLSVVRCLLATETTTMPYSLT